MKIKPEAEYLLMGILRFGSKHGYEIWREIKETARLNWYISTSQIYALLKRLEGKGLIASVFQNQSARPSKRVYSITDKGVTAFDDWVHRPISHIRDFRIEFIAKLHFLHTLGLPGWKRLIDGQVNVLKELKADLVRRGDGENDSFNAIIVNFKLTTVDNILGWLSNHAEPFFENKAALGFIKNKL